MRERNPWSTRRLMIAAVAALAALAACTETTPPPNGNLPVIVSFGAEPSDIGVGGSSTLTWTVSGNDVTIDVSAGAANVYDGTDLTGSLDVTPTETTTYTLTATNADGSVDADATVTVTPPTGPPTLTGLTAETVRLSQIALTWSVGGASTVEVYAAASSAPGADATLVTTLAGNTTGATIAIPTSARQTVRVCAVLGGERDCDTTQLTNVVTRSDDYDPYDLQQDIPGAFWPEDPIAGTLRDILENAAPESVIGFAADVTSIMVRGVDLEQFALPVGWVDSHLIVRDDVTISGPPSGVTLTGTSAALAVPGAPGDPFTYQSRMVHVLGGVEATLENLTISGGDFIYRGGGIRNDGTLTLVDTTVTGNRSWERGGGIWNTGTLTLLRSAVIDNESFTSEEELEDAEYEIRGGSPTPMAPDGQGGGFYNVAGATLRLIDSIVEDNRARLQGGGLFLEAGSTTTLEGASTIQGNSAGNGGRGIHHLYFSGAQDTSLVPRLSIDYGTGNPPTNYLGVLVANGTSVGPASATPAWTIRDR